MTANFKYSSIENLDKLRELQPNRPVLVSEFWPGWFDHWFNPIHGTLSIDGELAISRDFSGRGLSGPWSNSTQATRGRGGATPPLLQSVIPALDEARLADRGLHTVAGSSPMSCCT